MKAILYVRTSTDHQDVDNQLLDLRRYAAARGWEIVAEHADVGYSGVKGKRPALTRLMDDVREGRCDVVVVWKFDRFARSVRHLLDALEVMRQREIDFVSMTEAIDTSTEMGRMVMLMLGSISEMERSHTIERIHAGLRRAKAQGKRLGRPRSDVSRARILQLHGQGLSLRQIARKLDTSSATVHRTIRAENG